MSVCGGAVRDGGCQQWHWLCSSLVLGKEREVLHLLASPGGLSWGRQAAVLPVPLQPCHLMPCVPEPPEAGGNGGPLAPDQCEDTFVMPTGFTGCMYVSRSCSLSNSVILVSLEMTLHRQRWGDVHVLRGRDPVYPSESSLRG